MSYYSFLLSCLQRLFSVSTSTIATYFHVFILHLISIDLQSSCSVNSRTLQSLQLSSRNEPDPEDYSEREDGETELGAVEKTSLGDSTQNLSNEVLDDIIEVDGKTSQALHASYR